ncbi:MAG: DUF2442 domain-containing protein [Acidobacteriota bacterium]
MPRLLEVKPQPQFKLWVRYDDGSQGEVDLADLAGRGVFTSWNTPGRFETVSVGPQGQLSWSDDIELCPDATYMRLTGKTPEEVFPALRKADASA